MLTKTNVRPGNLAPGRESVSAKMGFEAPKILELLARPQQREGRSALCLVVTGDSFAHTLEEASAAVRIASVRRGSRRRVDEGIAERDEPGAQRLNIVIEVRTAPREARVAIPAERGE